HIPALLEHWLEPVLAPGMEMIAKYDVARPNVGFLKDEHALHVWEYGLASMSVLVALIGWQGARWLYKDNANPLPARLLQSTNPLIQSVHRLVYNKYFVDEVYYTMFVRGMAYVWNGLRN